MFNIAAGSLVTSVLGLGAWNFVAQVDPSIIQQGGDLAKLGVPGILGVIALGSVIALVKVFKIYKESNDTNNIKLQELIAKGIESNVKAADAMQEVTEVIRSCKK